MLWFLKLFDLLLIYAKHTNDPLFLSCGGSNVLHEKDIQGGVSKDIEMSVPL